MASNETQAAKTNYETSRFGHNIRIAMRALLNRVYMSAGQERDTVDRFHKLYYDANLFGKTWRDTYWMGTRVAKCPLDLWIYQEILHELKPDLIVECGTLHGGSAAYMASICDLLGHGHILTIDVREREGRPIHPRVRYHTGSSTAPETLELVRSLINPGDTVLTILDSDHRKAHVLDELKLYADITTVGSYMVVEDTNLNGHPVAPEFGPGPMEALEEFMETETRYEIDASKEKFYLTFNPKGFLKRIE
ncbi:MAG: CmcI family methyltransferase [Bacteroidota bacterium]